MATVQERLYIPDDINIKILTGEYIRLGSVVRHNTGSQKGQIVTHLESIKLPRRGLQVIQFAINNPTLVKGGIELAIVTGKGFLNKVKKNKEPVVVVKFREALKVYLNAANEGALTIEIITDLMERLGEVERHSDFEKIKIVFSTDELSLIVNQLFEHTKNLAANNAIELTSVEKEISSNTIINLQRILEAQKRIFELAS